jgi:predicted PurR-regulated permease PerM
LRKNLQSGTLRRQRNCRGAVYRREGIATRGLMDMNSEPRRNGSTPVAAARAATDLDFARMSLPPLVTIVGVTAILYLGRDVFLPFAIALLLTFALAPIVSFLRRRSIPKILAVIITVGIAFAFIAAFAFLVASQVSNLAQNIPTYQTNIVEKVRSLRELGAGGGLVDHVTRVIERVGEELRLGTQPAGPAENAPKPLPVEIVSQESPLDLLQNIVVPLISPFATAGLVLVVVVFMLLERRRCATGSSGLPVMAICTQRPKLCRMLARASAAIC